MTKENIIIKPAYFKTAEAIFNHIKKLEEDKNSFPKVIAICGESGSGKSVSAICIQQTLKKEGIESFIFHMDDYFNLSPNANHHKRLLNINSVGTGEVNLEHLQSNINDFKNGISTIIKPIVHYKKELILPEEINLSPYHCIIVEGTYVGLLNNIDLRIFMDRTYKETFLQRLERGRDESSDFIERVLEIEHHIIRVQRDSADLIVLADYSVTTKN